jgi:hypothetical protein
MSESAWRPSESAWRWRVAKTSPSSRASPPLPRTAAAPGFRIFPTQPAGLCRRQRCSRTSAQQRRRGLCWSCRNRSSCPIPKSTRLTSRRQDPDVQRLPPHQRPAREHVGSRPGGAGPVRVVVKISHRLGVEPDAVVTPLLHTQGKEQLRLPNVRLNARPHWPCRAGIPFQYPVSVPRLPAAGSSAQRPFRPCRCPAASRPPLRRLRAATICGSPLPGQGTRIVGYIRIVVHYIDSQSQPAGSETVPPAPAPAPSRP